jgi:hypothetical protein
VYLFRVQVKTCMNAEELAETEDTGNVERTEAYKASGSFPIIDDVKATYDFNAHIGELVDPEIAGYASFKRLIPSSNNRGRPSLAKQKSTEVHHMQFFKPRGQNVALMRYKTSAQSTQWYPEGANGRDNVGIPIFLVDAVLPGLDITPPLADYHAPWKNSEEVKAAILGLREAHPHHMSDAQHDAWVTFFDSIPESPHDVALADLPHCRLRARSELALRHPPPPPPGARAPDRSVLDPPNVPPVPTMTHSAWNTAARRSEVDDLLSGTFLRRGFRRISIRLCCLGVVPEPVYLFGSAICQLRRLLVYDCSARWQRF